MRTLVATDLSEASDEALRQAFASARSAGGPVAICHVMPEFAQVQGLFPLDAPSDLATDFEPRAQTINAMREQLRRVFPTAAEDVEMRLDEGAPYAGILNQAERWRADRVVVGSGTKTGIERVLLGGRDRVSGGFHGANQRARCHHEITMEKPAPKFVVG